MRHHTKDKGDIGLGFVIADLLEHGIQVALPMSEHLPFDCIAINPSGELRKVQVKYRTAKNGLVGIRKFSTWVDRKGIHTRKHEKSDYDCFAVYCPTNRQCYYVNVSETGQSTYMGLRIKPVKNMSGRKQHDADKFRDPHRIF